MAMIGVGNHDVTILATALKKASTGNVQIAVRFQQDETGDTITGYFATSERAWPYTEEKLKTMGWDPLANGYRFEDLNLEPSPLAGNRVNIAVKSELDNQGKPVSKVSFVNPLGGGIERMDADEATSFAAQLRARLTGSNYTPPPRRSPEEAPPPSDDDDMPAFLRE